MDDDARRRLESVAVAANKSLLHPEDWKRFYRFVITVHLTRQYVSDADVQAFLGEHGFSRESDDAMIRRLTTVFNEGRELLREYDGHRKSGEDG